MSARQAAKVYRRSPIAYGLWLVASLAVLGCKGPSGDTNRKDGANETKAARSEVECGPVRMTVDVQPNPARLSDEPTMTLTIDYEKGVKVTSPPFGDAVGDFIIRDYRQSLPQSRGSRETLEQTYVLEPKWSGELQVNPIVVTFVDQREGADRKEHMIETDAVTVTVASVVESDLPSLDNLRPLSGPVQIPAKPFSWLAWCTLSLVLVSLVGYGCWRYRRRRVDTSKLQLSPQEMAYLELEQLLESGQADNDVKHFYVSLTGIVRRYIEGTTGVHAPEQTTEEFLREINTGNVFASAEQQRLKGFLEAADFVKYAAHEPKASDIEDMFNRAKAFIGLVQTSEASA